MAEHHPGPCRKRDTFDAGAGELLRQPKAVWATAGASVVAFMGIGLVDPILPSIAQGLDATASQVSLLFTSYFLITAVAMLVTGFVSSRIGGREDPAARPRPRRGLRRARGHLRLGRRTRRLPGRLGPRQRAVRLHGPRRDRRSRGRRQRGGDPALRVRARPRHGLRPAARRAARRRQLALPVLRHRVPDGDRLPVPSPPSSRNSRSPRAGPRCSTRSRALGPRRPRLRGGLRVLLQLHVLHRAGLHPVRAGHDAVQVGGRVLLPGVCCSPSSR